MIKIKFWIANPQYLDFQCPWCKEKAMSMGEVVCMECNGVLPDIEIMADSVDERFEFFTEAARGYLG